MVKQKKKQQQDIDFLRWRFKEKPLMFYSISVASKTTFYFHDLFSTLTSKVVYMEEQNHGSWTGTDGKRHRKWNILVS